MHRKKITYAERLMRHFEVCLQCRSAKINPTVGLCDTGRTLTRKTLDERHPDPERTAQ